MSDLWLIILFGALLTFATRAGGYLFLSRMTTVPPRLEAALDAVPSAVIAALVAPALVTGTWKEVAALALGALLALRFGITVSVFVPVAALAVSRALL
ncbi:MAG: AzlD domain-containing protein [Pseudomonadota bacterium]